MRQVFVENDNQEKKGAVYYQGVSGCFSAAPDIKSAGVLRILLFQWATSIDQERKHDLSHPFSIAEREQICDSAAHRVNRISNLLRRVALCITRDLIATKNYASVRGRRECRRRRRQSEKSDSVGLGNREERKRSNRTALHCTPR